MKINKLQRGFIPLLFSFVTLPLWAQVGEQRNNLSIGVNGGVNYNNVTFEPKVKQNGMMAFNGGLTMRYISEKYFAMICGVQLELNYSQRGWDEKIEDGTDNTYTRTMNYLEVPFLAHLAFGRDCGPQFFLNLGPQIAFLLSESEKMSDNWNPEGRINTQYGKMAEKNFDY